MHELDRLTWQKISELVILLWVEYVWKKKVNLADDPSRGESPIVEELVSATLRCVLLLRSAGARSMILSKSFSEG